MPNLAFCGVDCVLRQPAGVDARGRLTNPLLEAIFLPPSATAP